MHFTSMSGFVKIITILFNKTGRVICNGRFYHKGKLLLRRYSYEKV